MYKKIVLAYDGSSFSMAALHQGANIAKDCKAELHLLSIVETTGSMAIAEAVGTEDVWGVEQLHLEEAIRRRCRAARVGADRRGLRSRWRPGQRNRRLRARNRRRSGGARPHRKGCAVPLVRQLDRVSAA